MSDTILAALIGAVSSIIVALISRQTAHGKRLEFRSIPVHQLSTPSWMVTLALLILWLFISPAAIHHDLAGNNFFLIPVVLVILAIARPIRPLTAVWVSLAIFSANFVLGPLANRLAGSSYDTTFGLEFAKLWPILLISFVAAALVGGTCALRLRQSPPDLSEEEAPKRTSQEQVPMTDSAFAAALERLAALHSDGKLSDDEFRAAKKRLLNDH